MANDGIGIPVSRRATCVYCAVILDTHANGNYELATGWVKKAPKSGNSATLQMKHGKYACPECIDRLRHDINPGQGSLFNIDMGANDYPLPQL